MSRRKRLRAGGTLAPPRLISLTDELWWDISIYMRDNGLTNTSQAIRDLLKTGLGVMYDTISEEELLAGIEALAPGTVKH